MQCIAFWKQNMEIDEHDVTTVHLTYAVLVTARNKCQR
jgi:hypothetical protein